MCDRPRVSCARDDPAVRRWAVPRRDRSIAREIERGTTRLAWSISPSRLRWYLHRMLPVVVAALAPTFVVGVAADRLARGALARTWTVAKSFDGSRHSRRSHRDTALVMTAGAIGLGAVIGRPLQTMILALVLGGLGCHGGNEIHEQLHRD